MTASLVKPPFARRSRPQARLSEILVPFTDEEFAIVEAEAIAVGLSIEAFLIMRALDAGEVKGNA